MRIFGITITGAGILYACGIAMTIYGGMIVYSSVVSLAATIGAR